MTKKEHPALTLGKQRHIGKPFTKIPVELVTISRTYSNPVGLFINNKTSLDPVGLFTLIQTSTPARLPMKGNRAVLSPIGSAIGRKIVLLFPSQSESATKRANWIPDRCAQNLPQTWIRSSEGKTILSRAAER
jgi:hypothetical protein